MLQYQIYHYTLLGKHYSNSEDYYSSKKNQTDLKYFTNWKIKFKNHHKNYINREKQ